MTTVVRSARLLSLVATSALGCTALFEAPWPPSGAGGGADDEPVPGLFDHLATRFAPPPGGLRRLTTSHYLASVSDVLGTPLTLPTSLEPDTLVDGLSAIGASEVPISARGVEQYDEAARALAAQVFSEAARRQAFVGCTPTRGDDACARAFLTRLGRRAWRRPLEADEVTRYLALSAQVGTALGDVWKGLEYLTAALLQSPYFLHRLEQGTLDASTGHHHLGAHELATRLSFFLWGTTPDEALLAAADRGELATTAGLRRQVERLLASPRVRPSLLAFFEEHWHLSSLQRLERDATLYPRATAALGPALRTEWQLALADIAFDPSADFRDVLTSPFTYVNELVAPLYGLEASGPSFVKVTLPAGQGRAGLLGWSGVLASTGHHNRSSPTARGVFVRRKLLCQTIPPPPPMVSNSLDSPGTPDQSRSFRERLEAHRRDPSCAGCHALLDPIGLGLENYDALGQYRESDLGLPIDAEGDLDGTAFTKAVGLGALLRGQSRFTDCVVKNLYSHAVGHAVTSGEGPTIRQVAQQFAGSGFHFTELVTAIAESDGFQRTGGPR